MHISTILYWLLWILWGVAMVAGLVVSVWGLVVRISFRTRVKNEDILKFLRKTFDAITAGFLSSIFFGYPIAEGLLKGNYGLVVVIYFIFVAFLIFAWSRFFLAKKLIVKLQ